MGQTDQIRRGAALLHLAAGLLLVAEPLHQAARARDQQGIALRQIVDHPPALRQQRLIRLHAIQIQLRQAAVHERVGMAVTGAVLAVIDFVDRCMPAAEAFARDDVVAVAPVAGDFAQREQRSIHINGTEQRGMALGRRVLDEIVGQSARGVERPLIVESPVVGNRSWIVPSQLVLCHIATHPASIQERTHRQYIARACTPDTRTHAGVHPS